MPIARRISTIAGMDATAGEQLSGRTRLIRAPLAPVALALACGITAGRFAPFATGFWTVLGGVALLLAAVTVGRKHLHLAATIAVGAAVFAAGGVHVRLMYFTVDEDHVVTFTAERPILATLRGRVVTSPQVFDQDPGVRLGYRRPARTGFLLDCDAVGVNKADGTGRTWRSASGLVRVSVGEVDDRLALGGQVELLGWAGRFSSPDNPGQFDRAAVARRNHTLVWMSVPGADGVTIRGTARTPWYARALWNVRAAGRQHLLGCGDLEGGRLLNALIIGERDPALRSLNRTMVRAGIAHFLSISGLHLGVFLGCVYLLCRLVAMTPRRSAAVVLVVLGMYVTLAQPRAPLLRSAIMAAAICLAVIFRRPRATLNALGGAGVVLLVMDPLQLFAPGFQLSFAIVAGLILLAHRVRVLLFGRWLRRRGLMVFRNEQRARRWLYHTAGNWLTGGIAMAVTAYIVAAPLVAWHFGIFSPWAPLLSVVLFPLVLVVLVCGYVSIILAWPMPNLSHSVGQLAGWSSGALAWAVDAIGNLPALGWQVQPVGGEWVILCYAVIVLLAVRRSLPFGRVLAGLATAVLVAVTACGQRTAPPPAQAELNVLAVGAGQCVVLRCPSGKVFIFDAGTRSGFDAGEQVLRPFLQTRRLGDPDGTFISHANTDHFNALPSLMQGGSIGRVYVNTYFQDPACAAAEDVARLGEMLRDGSAQVVTIGAGDMVALDEGTKVEVLWPPPDREDLTVNDTSLVLRITCDGRSVLVTGDLDSVGQAALTTAPGAPSADVLLLPHHGGWEETLPAFVRAVAPKYVIVSTAREPTGPIDRTGRGQRFYRDIHNAYQYYSTPRNGWICVRFGGGRITVQTMR